jgi:hypothetical protein
MKGELGSMLKEAAVVCFEMLFEQMPGETAENHEDNHYGLY